MIIQRLFMRQPRVSPAAIYIEPLSLDTAVFIPGIFLTPKNQQVKKDIALYNTSENFI